MKEGAHVLANKYSSIQFRSLKLDKVLLYYNDQAISRIIIFKILNKLKTDLEI